MKMCLRVVLVLRRTERSLPLFVGCHWLLAASALHATRADQPPVAPAAQRIIAIAPNSAEVICALGACDRIVGVSKFCVYPPELLQRPKVGGFSDPDLERIAALRPDLLVVRGRNDALERLCVSLNIPIHRDETDTLAGIEDCLRDLGGKLGLAEQAEVRIAEFRTRVRSIQRRVSGRPRPRVMLTISRTPDRLANILTSGRGTFLDEMLEIAGGKNVFGDLDMAYPQVSPEAILAKQPDVILELMPETQIIPELEAQMRGQWSELGSLPAVVKGRVHFLTDDNGLIPSPRYVEFIDKVSRLLHPEPADAP